MMSPSSSKSFSFDGTAKESVNNFIYIVLYFTLGIVFILSWSFSTSLYRIALHVLCTYHYIVSLIITVP